MLMRVSGGTGGIREYLENGRKEGREFTREELDTRLPLAGDLALTDTIIEAMPGHGEKYLHVTLSFKEDEISADTLKAIADDFESFAFSAFEAGEFNMYAEAHLPRRTSYTHAGTGELIERKPHIHIVVPERNMLSGQHLNPFGKVDQQTAFLEAFQEHVNAKYGLASPKDHRRAELTPASEMISRYKGDQFSGAGRTLKEQILDDVLSRRIESMDAFRSLLDEHGQVRTRNAGKAGEYLNVKPGDADKGVNLKESVFSRDFIELPTEAKRAQLTREAAQHYETAKPARPTPQEINDRLDDWHERRAKEIKYLNSGNRKQHAAYRAADPDTRKAMLAEREAAFYTKHRKEPEHEQRSDQRRVVADIEDNLRTAGRHIESARRIDRDPERTRGKLADRRAVRAIAATLERHGRDQKAPWDGEKPGHQAGSVVERYEHEARERRHGAHVAGSGEFATIKQKLGTEQLLAHVSHTHGVIPEKYAITKGRDGSDRIQCGTRNLNVSDFLTKELNLSWKEAAPVLREAYAKQEGREHTAAREKPRKELWNEYREQWTPQQRTRREKGWSEQRDDEKKRRANIKAVFYAKRGMIQGNRTLTPIERKAAMSVARVEKIMDEQALRESIKQERESLRAEYQKPHTERYRDFLTEKANAGDVDALDELRRQAGPQKREPEAAPTLQAATPASTAPFQGLQYRVHRNGDVTYSDTKGAVLRDETQRVAILRNDDATLAAGLRLAQQKFYNPKRGSTELDMTGSEDFQRKAVEVAVKEGIAVTFTDKKLEAYRVELEAKQRAGRDYIDAHRRFADNAKAADKTTGAARETKPLDPKQEKERESKKRTRSNKAATERPAPKPTKNRDTNGPDFSL